jgi:hypothetical protein
LFGEDIFNDFYRFGRAFLTNQIACFWLYDYVRHTEETGRGGGEESPHHVAEYFKTFFKETGLIFSHGQHCCGI